jgi:hypothetical protein
MVAPVRFEVVLATVVDATAASTSAASSAASIPETYLASIQHLPMSTRRIWVELGGCERYYVVVAHIIDSAVAAAIATAAIAAAIVAAHMPPHVIVMLVMLLGM